MIYLQYDAASMGFEELSCASIVTRANISGSSLLGTLYDHTLSARRVYNIVISADAIKGDDEYNFLEAFHLSNNKSLSFDGSSFSEVVSSAGDIPIESIEGIRSLPEIKLTLQLRYASTDRLTGEEMFDANI